LPRTQASKYLLRMNCKGPCKEAVKVAIYIKTGSLIRNDCHDDCGWRECHLSIHVHRKVAGRKCKRFCLRRFSLTAYQGTDAFNLNLPFF
jgi:hypothetical protein